MRKFAFIFPGQGAQKTGMGLDLFKNFQVSRDVFELCNDTLKRDISKLCFEGDDEKLKLTINSQIAILTTSIAALAAFRSETDINPVFCAGHSLGEYSAMYCASIMSLETSFLAIEKRAELMNYASEKNAGSMAAILGLEPNIIRDVISGIDSYVDVANYNNQSQTVITGTLEGIEKASAVLKDAGARRIVPLNVSGAFHSKLMKEAGDEFGNFVKDLSLSNAQIPVVTNVDYEITTKAEDFRDKMPRQIYSSVYWLQSVKKMIENGVDTFIEFGEGSILSGLNKKICPELKTYSISNSETLRHVIDELE